MALGLSAANANAILNALCRATSFTGPAALWVKLHVGDPGTGAGNPAAHTTRIQATFGAVAAGGGISNTVALSWTGVTGAEDYTHFSVWDASTAGTFQFSGTMTANAVLVGDTFQIPVGDLDVTLPVAA